MVNIFVRWTCYINILLVKLVSHWFFLLRKRIVFIELVACCFIFVSWNLFRANFFLWKLLLIVFRSVKLVNWFLHAEFLHKTDLGWYFSLWNLYIDFLLMKLILLMKLLVCWFLFLEIIVCWFFIVCETSCILIFLIVRIVNWSYLLVILIIVIELLVCWF